MVTAPRKGEAEAGLPDIDVVILAEVQLGVDCLGVQLREELEEARELLRSKQLCLGPASRCLGHGQVLLLVLRQPLATGKTQGVEDEHHHKPASAPRPPSSLL